MDTYRFNLVLKQTFRSKKKGRKEKLRHLAFSHIMSEKKGEKKTKNKLLLIRITSSRLEGYNKGIEAGNYDLALHQEVKPPSRVLNKGSRFFGFDASPLQEEGLTFLWR